MRFIETNEAKYLDIKKAPPKRGVLEQKYGLNRFNVPNAVGIFQNRTVAGEVADSGDVVNGFLCPDVFVQIIFFRIMNGLGESFQICQMK